MLFSLPGYAQQWLGVFFLPFISVFQDLPALESYCEFHVKAVDSELSPGSALMGI